MGDSRAEKQNRQPFVRFSNLTNFMFLKLPNRIPKWKWVGEARRSGFRLPQSSFPLLHSYSAPTKWGALPICSFAFFSYFTISQQSSFKFLFSLFSFLQPKSIHIKTTHPVDTFVFAKDCKLFPKICKFKARLVLESDYHHIDGYHIIIWSP